MLAVYLCIVIAIMSSVVSYCCNVLCCLLFNVSFWPVTSLHINHVYLSYHIISVILGEKKEN